MTVVKPRRQSCATSCRNILVLNRESGSLVFIYTMFLDVNKSRHVTYAVSLYILKYAWCVYIYIYRYLHT